jgi:hypothetical protein
VIDRIGLPLAVDLAAKTRWGKPVGEAGVSLPGRIGSGENPIRADVNLAKES